MQRFKRTRLLEHAIDVQLAVEMIDLVLQRLREQALGIADALLATAPILRLDRYAFGAVDSTPEAWYRQTTLVQLVLTERS